MNEELPVGGTPENQASPPPAEPTASAATEPAPPAPAAEPVAPEPAAPEPVAPEPPAPVATESPEPRLRLNPTVDPETAKAVPNVSSLSGGPAADAPAPAPAPEPEPVEAPLAPKGRAPAVEIPRKQETQLDADIEADIAAALAAGELPTALSAAAEATQGAAPAPVSLETLEPGAKLKATVVSITNEDVIVDLGFRVSGTVPVRQFDGKTPEKGAKIDVVVDKVAEDIVHCGLTKASRQAANWDQVAVGQIVDCMVTKSNKGGLEVSISSLRGFLPAGQVDVGFVSELDKYVGQKIRVKITEVNPGKRNLVVSRRQFLEIERAENREKLMQTLAVGQTHQGVVKTIKDYGAFIDLGGVDGLLHVGEMSWSRVNHPSDVLKEGQTVDVQVLQIDNEKGKISLGMRQLFQNPWNDVENRFPVNGTVRGKVTKTTDFGAFVELDKGIEGLIHISELEYRRVHRVTDVVKEGQEVDAKVLSIDLAKKRIALSLKQLQARPDAPARKDDADLAPSSSEPYERKRKGPLKGGTAGGGGAGGMFFGGGSE